MFNVKYTFFIFSMFLFLGFGFAVSDYAYILKLDNYSTYPNTIYPNSEVSLNLTMSNISLSNDAEKVTFSLNNNNANFESLKDFDYIEIIKFNQTGTGVLRFKVNQNTPGGYYSLPYKIEYYNKSQKYTIDSQLTIYVSNYNRLNVVLDNYPKDNLYLNDEVNISGKVKNEGNTTLTGVDILLNYSARIIPLSEVSLFLEDVLPGESKEFEFNFKIPKTTTPGIYDLNIFAKDVSLNSDIEKLSLVIEDKPYLIISSINKLITNNGNILSQGSDFSLSVQLENISKSKAKSVYVKILNLDEIKFIGNDIAYLGSIDSEDTGAGIFDLIIDNRAKVGNNILKLEIVYSDEYDFEHKDYKEISLLITKKKASGAWVSILVLLLIAGAIGYYFYRKNQKHNKIKNIK